MSPWIGAGALGLLHGGQQIARSPTPSGPPGLHYTVIPLPVAPAQEITMQQRQDALEATYTGWLQSAVDLYRLTVERNGFMTGVLDTMAAIIALPLAWQGGTPEMISALQDQDGTPGDYSRMHPENECAKIFKDGIGLGFGLGQYLLMCWRCDGVEWDRRPAPTEAHVEIELCRTCKARRVDRPAGERELFQLRWRDARWLWRDPVTLQWHYNGRQAMVPVNPGDGEWFLFRTVPDQDIWLHGPWALGTEAAIMARDATYDQANTAAVCAPTHVFQAKPTGGTDPKTRRDVEAQAENLRFANRIILPGEWEHDIHAAKAEFVDVCGAIVTWAGDQWEVALTGNKMGQQSGTGFANMDVYQRVTTKRRQFYAGAWIRQIRAQGLIWWSLSNYGTRNAPVGVYDCESPEEKKAKADADKADGEAVEALAAGYGAVGFELEPAYVAERAQRRGLRVRPKTVPVQPGAVPSPTATPSPTTSSTGVPAAQVPEEDDGEDDEADGARLAAEYTVAGLDRCPYHGRTHYCPKCGIVREYGLDPVSHQPRIAWRPKRRVPRPAQIGPCTAGQPGTGVLT